MYARIAVGAHDFAGAAYRMTASLIWQSRVLVKRILSTTYKVVEYAYERIEESKQARCEIDEVHQSSNNSSQYVASS